MRFEVMESFVQQLVLHKHHCDKWRFREHAKHEYAGFYGILCETCKTHWEIDPALLMGTSWRYIRGGDKHAFYDFIQNLNCPGYPDGSYEDLFTVHVVMSS